MVIDSLWDDVIFQNKYLPLNKNVHMSLHTMSYVLTI